jgi:hypothetical protein
MFKSLPHAFGIGIFINNCWRLSSARQRQRFTWEIRVEYEISQLGALQQWERICHEPRAAITNYPAALKIGDTRPLPELFAAAGIGFDFSERTLLPLIDAAEDARREILEHPKRFERASVKRRRWNVIINQDYRKGIDRHVEQRIGPATAR